MVKLNATENRELEEWHKTRVRLWKAYDESFTEGISHEDERDRLLALAEYLDRMIDKLLVTVRKLDT